MTESISRKFSRLGLGVSDTGTLTVNSATATKWATARTLTLTGDVSGNVSIDGSENVTLTATVSGNSVALGTDTTGNYVASITNGNYIIGGNGGSEGATLTLAVDATSANTASKVVARDASGNFSAGTITATLSGNASTVTNGVYTTDTGTVTNTMLAGSIANNKLANSTISGISLGSNLATLTLGVSGTGLSGSQTYNGSGAATFTVTSNATSANTASTIVARDASGNFTAGTITAALSGNATTATTLQTARTINGVSFNGSADITVADSTKLPLAGGTMTGTITGGMSAGAQVVEFANADNYVSMRVIRNNAASANRDGMYIGYGNVNSGATRIYGAGSVSGHALIDASGNWFRSDGVQYVLNTGTWGINISGTSASTDLINSVGITGNLDTMYQARTFGWEPSTNGRPTDQYGQGIAVVSAGNTHNNTNNWITQLGFGTNMNTAYFRTKVNASSWGAWRTFIHSGNYTSYSPSLTGDGASGTWGINITGNADTVDSLHASAFMRAAGTENAGTIIIRDNRSTTNYYSTVALEIRSSDQRAVIGLHRDGFSHVGIAHETTNVLRFNFNSGDVYLNHNVGTVIGSGNYSSYVNYGNPSTRGVYQISNWNQTTYPNTHFLSSESSTTNAPNTDFTYGMQYSFHRDGAGYRTQMVTSLYSDLNIWVRNSRDSDVWTAWKVLLHSGNYSSYALPLSGGTLTGGVTAPSYTLSGGFSITHPGLGYASFNNWVLLPGTHGFYSGNNSAHFYPNNGVFGAWRISGSRNSYNGIEFDAGNGNVVLMVRGDSNVSGMHNNGYGWHYYWEGGTFYIGKNTFGGNMVVALDASNYTSYAINRGGDTVSGLFYFLMNSGGYSGSLVNGAIQVYSTGGNSAYMSFHRGGSYAVNMGLDADNVLRIGGWSAAANRLQMDMSGNLTMAGNVTAYSDVRLKNNIETITDALTKVSRLRGVSFTRNDQEDTTRKHIGVIAQELEEVVPEVVFQDASGTKNVAYGNMIGLLIEAIKEQQRKIEELENRINNS